MPITEAEFWFLSSRHSFLCFFLILHLQNDQVSGIVHLKIENLTQTTQFLNETRFVTENSDHVTSYFLKKKVLILNYTAKSIWSKPFQHFEIWGDILRNGKFMVDPGKKTFHFTLSKRFCESALIHNRTIVRYLQCTLQCTKNINKKYILRCRLHSALYSWT